MKKLFCVLFLYTASAIASPTKDLQDYLIHLEPQQADLSVVKDLIQKGADPKALTIVGGNSFNAAVDAFSYGSSDAAYAPALRDIAFYLAGLGVDTNLPGERQLTPLFILLRFAAPGPLRDEMFNFLVSQPVDFNLQGKGTSIAVHLAGGRYNTYLDRLVTLGFDLSKAEIYGGNFTHVAAGVRPKSGETLLLKYLLDRVPQSEHKKLISQKRRDGSEPLHYAAFRNNLEAVKYLIEVQGVDINAVNNSDETALAIAEEFNFTDIVTYLQSRGAAPTVVDGKVKCDQAFRGELTYARVVDLIDTCKIRSIENLLPLFPKKYRSNYTLAYGTLAVQDASTEFPQVILFGQDGQLMMAFNGHRSQRGYKNLEIIEFNKATKSFEFRDIEFPEIPFFGQVKFSEVNPVKCLSCHGQKPRPLWDNWTFWPGKYGSEMEFKSPQEEKFYQTFLKQRNKGRYQHLLENYLGPTRTVFGQAVTGDTVNLRMDDIVNNLVSQKIVREISQNPALTKFKYALLGALSCSQIPIQDFLPSNVKNSFKLSLDALIENTRQLDLQEFKNRLMLQENFLGSEVTGLYVVQQKKTQEGVNAAGRNFDLKQTAQVRFLVENNSVSTIGWATAFNLGNPSYSTISWEWIEGLLWKELLDPTTDANLYKNYESVSNTRKINLFYGTPNEAKVCPELQQKSLDLLK